MILGVDASNIRDGGGLTHLVELLSAAKPDKYGIEKVIVWGGKKTIDQLPKAIWLDKHHVPLLDSLQACRILWQHYALPKIASKSCSLLLVPGGNYHGKGIPYIAISQNLLPFDNTEKRRFGISWTRLRYSLLKFGQTSTFKHASGIIFLTETARNLISHEIGNIYSSTVIIPHGISNGYRRKLPQQSAPEHFSDTNLFRWLYVSIVNLYKHQWNVIEAIAKLRMEGCHMALDLIGPIHPQARHLFKAAINKWDPNREFVHYHGRLSHQTLPEFYHQATGFVFASSCENLPIILLEAMSSGLPIACSDRGPMPEILVDAGIYFDPEDVSSIMRSMRYIYLDPDKRYNLSLKASQYSEKYTWKRCADETFSFIAKVANK